MNEVTSNKISEVKWSWKCNGLARELNWKQTKLKGKKISEEQKWPKAVITKYSRWLLCNYQQVEEKADLLAKTLKWQRFFCLAGKRFTLRENYDATTE